MLQKVNGNGAGKNGQAPLPDGCIKLDLGENRFGLQAEIRTSRGISRAHIVRDGAELFSTAVHEDPLHNCAALSVPYNPRPELETVKGLRLEAHCERKGDVCGLSLVVRDKDNTVAELGGRITVRQPSPPEDVTLDTATLVNL